MNEQKLHQIIIQAAKQIPSDHSVPFSFEKRVMHAIRQVGEVDILTIWNRMLWRAALPCLLIMALTGAWVNFSGEQQVAVAVDADLPDLEYAILMPDPDAEENW